MFYPVPPASLHDVWGRVRPMLRAIQKKAPANWIPEDVYREVSEGRAALFLADKSLLVTVAETEDFTRIPTLHIWLAYTAADNFGEGLEWVRQHAKQFGFQKITFDSPRKGWERRFAPVSTRYRLDE